MIPQKTKTDLSQISKIGSLISLQQAQEMIEAYQQQEPDGIRSFLYGRHIFDKLLSVPGCEGIRVFNGLNSKGIHALVFVAVDGNNRNILEYKVSTPDGIITVAAPLADDGVYCPFDCPKGGGFGVVESPEWETYIWTNNSFGGKKIAEIGSFISRKTAIDMINAYQSEEPDNIFSVLYGRDNFETLLSVPGCEGIRVFNALNQEGKNVFVFVTVDAQNNNIRQYKINTPDGVITVDAPLADGGVYCPFDCPKGGGLGIIQSPDWEDYIVAS